MTALRSIVFAMLLSTAALAAPVDQHEGHQATPRQPKVAPQPHPEKVLGWEPIRCWRQSTAGAITIGEPFTVVVTCAVYEGDNAQVIPDESRLGVASIQMAPFEILGGTHPPDVHRGTRRFFQYEYQLRIISPDAIGRDVNVPPLSISYRIHSRVGAAATLEGRDLSYLMPMMPIKVLSLVPADASDIRDASEASLGAVDSLRFRSSAFRVLAVTFGALALAMIVVAVVPLTRSKTTVDPVERHRAPSRAITAQAGKSLAEIQAGAAREGWDDDSIARALLAARLIAATAIDQTISQKPAGQNGGGSDGRLLVRHGLFRPTTTTVSSATTAIDVQRARSETPSRFSTTRQQKLEELQASLTTFTAALYRREPERDAAALDEAARQALNIASDIVERRRG